MLLESVEGGLAYPLLVAEVRQHCMLLAPACCKRLQRPMGLELQHTQSNTCTDVGPQNWLPEEALDAAMEKYDKDKSGARRRACAPATGHTAALLRGELGCS